MNVKPGWTTTEFWVTILTNVLALITMLLHKKLNVDVQAVAAGAAVIANSAYSFSRAIVKKAAHSSQTTTTTVTKAA